MNEISTKTSTKQNCVLHFMAKKNWIVLLAKRKQKKTAKKIRKMKDESE